jgi:hypothetical protein
MLVPCCPEEAKAEEKGRPKEVAKAAVRPDRRPDCHPLGSGSAQLNKRAWAEAVSGVEARQCRGVEAGYHPHQSVASVDVPFVAAHISSKIAGVGNGDQDPGSSSSR